ncbi:hypothetical protein DFH09DRAFT_1418940 [Mycena vulgaris]|nr:hypothetical protein DFH09DRAFT_1288343 [Mycena vulgaris]KAJ6524136.1 hypothetical protein DFH09DRAFT_1418940 [Mycena vulgaris]
MKFTASIPAFLALAASASASASVALISRTTGRSGLCSTVTANLAYDHRLLFPLTFCLPGGNFGACGSRIRDGQFAGALSAAHLLRAGGYSAVTRCLVNGRAISVVVADLCPGCAVNGIDLALGAVGALVNRAVGVIQVERDFM